MHRFDERDIGLDIDYNLNEKKGPTGMQEKNAVERGSETTTTDPITN
jgi:hypothetical protein